MNKSFWEAALERAKRTVFQTLAGSFPAGIVITVKMLQEIDIRLLWTVLAWLATGLLSGVASLLTSLATGLPEAQIEQKQPPDGIEDADGGDDA